MTLEELLNLIPSQHRSAPKFVATVSLFAQSQLYLQNLALSMIPKFDIDTAVGQQLDVVGRWAGISRNVNIAISGVYFSWDGADNVGWEYGVWPENNAPSSVTSLPDDSYRTLIRAKIAANQWDGTTNGAYAIWESVFPGLNILINDHQDMSYDLIVTGGIVDSLTQALITQGYIPLKPEGVMISNYYFPANSGPIFGWDIENDLIQGWDEGSWAIQVNPT